MTTRVAINPRIALSNQAGTAASCSVKALCRGMTNVAVVGAGVGGTMFGVGGGGNCAATGSGLCGCCTVGDGAANGEENDEDDAAVAPRGDGGGFDLARMFAIGPATSGDFGSDATLPLGRSLVPDPDGPGTVLGVGGPLSRSSRYSSLNSAGTISSFRACPFSSIAFHSSSLSRSTSSFVRPPQPPAHFHPRESFASRTLPVSLMSSPPTWPLASPAMNARIAHRAVRIPHAGCQDSS